jgi:hypothetical protein
LKKRCPAMATGAPLPASVKGGFTIEIVTGTGSGDPVANANTTSSVQRAVARTVTLVRSDVLAPAGAPIWNDVRGSLSAPHGPVGGGVDVTLVELDVVDAGLVDDVDVEVDDPVDLVVVLALSLPPWHAVASRASATNATRQGARLVTAPCSRR